MEHKKWIESIEWMFDQMRVESMQSLMYKLGKRSIIADSDQIWMIEEVTN